MRTAVLALAVLCLFQSPSNSAEPSDKEFLDGFYWGLGVSDLPTRGQMLEAFKGMETPPVKQGAFVLAVDPYGVAAKAGITPASIIGVINGEKVTGADDFRKVTRGIKAGDKLSMSVYLPVQRGSEIKWQRKTLRGTAKSQLESLSGVAVAEADDVAGITTYRHKDCSGVVNDESQVELEVIHDGERYQPQLTIKYVDSDGDWLFARSAKLKIGDKLIDIPIEEDFERDNDTRIWEWVRLRPKSVDGDDELMKLTELLSGQMSGKIIIVGDQYRKDRDLDPKELGRIREMWGFYRGVRSREIVPGH